MRWEWSGAATTNCSIAIYFRAIIFEAQTTAGTQDYVISISSASPEWAASTGVMDTVKQTFRTVP